MTNNKLTATVEHLIDAVGHWQQDYDPKEDSEQYDFFGQLSAALRELQERRKAERDSEPVAYMLDCVGGTDYSNHPERGGVPLYRHAQPAPEYPETLPCPVLLEPGMRFGKGVKTRLVLDAIQRRAKHYAELEAMTPEERAEHDASIKAFKAMLPQPALLDSLYEFGPDEIAISEHVTNLEDALRNSAAPQEVKGE